MSWLQANRRKATRQNFVKFYFFSKLLSNLFRYCIDFQDNSNKMKLVTILAASLLLFCMLAPSSVMASSKPCTRRCKKEVRSCKSIDVVQDTAVHCGSMEDFEKYLKCYKDCKDAKRRLTNHVLRLGKWTDLNQVMFCWSQKMKTYLLLMCMNSIIFLCTWLIWF